MVGFGYDIVIWMKNPTDVEKNECFILIDIFGFKIFKNIQQFYMYIFYRLRNIYHVSNIKSLNSML